MRLGIDRFIAGIAPKLSPRLLPETGATVSRNTRLDTGDLRPFFEESVLGALGRAVTIQSLFKYADQYWFHWNEDVDAATGPVNDDVHGRAYWTGQGAPKMTASDVALTGDDATLPNFSYQLGIPAPADACVATVVAIPGATPPAEGEVPVRETRAYVVTYVSAYDEEGPPSPPSALVSVDPERETVDLTSLPSAPAGPHNINRKRIYRTATGLTDAEFFLVAEVPVGQATYSDGLSTLALKTALPSLSWYPPPADMHSLTVLANGIMAGARGKDVCLSESFLPHAWPPEYQLSVEYPIVGLGALDTSVVILTEGHPYVAAGSAPASYSALKLPVHQACVSKRSICTILGYGVLYASPDGLVSVSAASAEIVSRDEFTKEQWREYRPETMLGRVHEGRCYLFYDKGAGVKGCLMFDPRLSAGARFVEVTRHATAAYLDIKRDLLVLVRAQTLYGWEDNPSGRMVFVWRSKLFIVKHAVNFGWAQLRGTNLNLGMTLRLYGDGVLRHTQAVTSDEPFALPGGYRAKEWQIELEGVGEVRDVQIGETLEDLV